MAPDLVTLSWCLGEIRESLAQADRHLGRQLESDAEDSSSLRAARAALHQAHGALRVVAVEGVPLLTQEAENLLDAVESGDVTLNGSVLARLQRAFQAVVEYCEELLRDVPHQPLHLYPYYRDLLQARRAERIHPADLFFPDLAVRLPEPEAGYTDDDAQALARARANFERGLLHLMRHAGDSTGAQAMREAVAVVCESRVASVNRAFWWVTQAYFEALAAGRLQVDVDVKRLLARFNLQLRKTLSERAPVAERLVKDMLFALASITDPTPTARAVREAFALEGSVPEDIELARYGRLDERVLRGAREGLARARSAFDKVSRGSTAELANFAQGIDAFRDATGQLPAEGLRALGEAFAQLRRTLAAQESVPGDALSLEIAAAILFAEQAMEHGARPGSEYDLHGHAMAQRLSAALAAGGSAGDDVPEWLRSLSQAAQERLTMAAFVAEAGNNLRGVEKVLDAFFRNPAQRDGLAQTVGALHQVAGALRLLGHDDAATGAQAVAGRVAAFVEDQRAPDPAECDKVAASAGAIGFFIESLQRPERAAGRFELDAKTGEFHAHFRRQSDESAPREVDAALATLADSQHAVQPPARPQESAEAVLSASADQAASLFVALAAQPGDPALRGELHGTMLRVRDASTLVDDAQRRAGAGEAVSLLAQDGASVDLERLAQALVAAGVPLPAAPEPAPALPEDEATIDSELLEIFLSEATEVLAAISENVGLSRAHPAEPQFLTTIRRGFHTLKGSSRMVGLAEFGEAGWAMEQVLNQWLGDERPGTDELYALIEDAHAQMGAWVALLVGSARAAQAIDPAPLVATATALREGRPLPLASAARDAEESARDAEESAPGAEESAQPADAFEEAVIAIGSADALQDVAVEHVEIGAAVEPQEMAADGGQAERSGDDAGDDSAQTVVIGGREISRPLYMIFLSEADELIQSLLADASEWIGEPARGATETAMRSAHSLAGSAAIVLLDPVHALAKGLERFMQAQRAAGETPSHEELQVFADATRSIQSMLHQFAGGTAPRQDSATTQAVEELAARWAAKLVQWPPSEVEPQDEALDASVADSLEVDTLEVDALEADALEVDAIELDEADAVEADAVEADALEVDALEADALEVELSEPEPVEAGPHEPGIAHAIDRELEELIADLPAPDGDDELAGELAVEALEQWADTRPALLEPEAGAADVELGAADVESSIAVPLPADELDAELLPIFVEEAEDYLPQIGENLRRWLAEPGDESLPQTLMRHLHTVKGSARMAGAMGLGQLLHEIETRVESLVGLGSIPVSLIEELTADHDRVASMFEAIKHPRSIPPAMPVEAAGQDAPAGASATDAGAWADTDGFAPPFPEDRAMSPGDDSGADATWHAAGAERQETPVGPKGSGEQAAAGHPAPGARATTPVPETDAGRRARPLVRVRADLLDKLVNEAGEVSIARSRLDNELGGLRQSLVDLTENVNRLRSQLREIEIQAESQIQARIAQQKEHERTFDPLEFDRYTRFQELTRMLAESVNDVATVQQNATRSLEEASQDLHRQGSVLRDLQQNLMRVRMVQFGSISDRLYRVVRQAGKELDKRVHLDIRGSAVEVDRGVLEKMAGPIEHLLRNSVTHGIESRELRTGRGKSETGEISIEVRQEGREIVLSLADDGGGLDYERIRARGLAAGLIAPGAQPGPRELADLIFMPGFTTASTVTELAGRGVGMDVVRAEVAALGGRIETESAPGEGTRFTIVLPLTLAVSQVVLVSAGRARFAVPSSSVEQVLQLKPQALAEAYEQRHLEWQGARVPMFYLGTLVELTELTPVAQHHSPVLILRSGHQRIALHCDEITRNQEVVVKSVGPQVARVRGVTGATVLGNGDVVLIINPVAFAQVAAGEVLERAVAAPRISAMLSEALPPVVMVVDDSLTVRKVTQRLLVREGYQVLLAKDGVDALRQMQDTVPDVMLVDIEMPRMDGFDLTRNVRADERFAQIPIVMITSRTADKHRNYAMSLGVNAYLGKPYAEEELLAHVASLSTARRREPTA